jgi:hypothetical protein
MSCQDILDQAVKSLLQSYKHCGLSKDDFAFSLIELKGNDLSRIGNWRGDVPIYPASIVKLFYLVAAFRWIEEKGVVFSHELERALKDMIVDSSNDATSYVIDILTGTTSGPELPESEMSDFWRKRSVFNEHFLELGYKDLNIIQKPWGDGPYGRERVLVGEQSENRNRLTTNATARLLGELVVGLASSAPFTAKAMEWLKREPSGDEPLQGHPSLDSADPQDQANAFSAKGLASTDKLWSKGGWTSLERHDAAYIERADGTRLIVVVFTQNHAKELSIIPALVRSLLSS